MSNWSDLAVHVLATRQATGPGVQDSIEAEAEGSYPRLSQMEAAEDPDEAAVMAAQLERLAFTDKKVSIGQQPVL